MFLDALKKQNPRFIECATELLKSNQVLPDTYLIDVDQFVENARVIKKTADEYGVTLYAMTKQFGRNPILAKLLVDELGYDGIVCVDFKEARHFSALGINVSHVGHLVQPPSGIVHELVSITKPEVITVYSIEKAKEISSAAVNANVVQKIMVKFYQHGDIIYPSQESGFLLSELDEVIQSLSALPNIAVEGVTHFPSFLYDEDKDVTVATHNFRTTMTAKEQAERLGCRISQVNVPSSTSCETIPLIASRGGTHGEPGHALTGTIPSNQNGMQPEKIAMLYLSEISHQHSGNSYCYGGGYYRRGRICGALAMDGSDPHGRFMPFMAGDDGSIDYHIQLAGTCPVGTPVIMAFRSQVFVTRSDVALVSGVSTGTPKIIGLYDSQGREL
ncbi:alanine racemase [Aeromonas allosaccharophila]|uniref:Alanine racemase n=1 Tax=Aeromonas allosaccharophila TaxID=656 RepID=A0A7T2PHJ4_9GAMM|nr:alanine racemase [Aeromonas allosaccharophila]QPR55908.1 alanine racemase [Aeromonas allosaccharophila]